MLFLAVQILTPLFSLTVLSFELFFSLLSRKLNEDSKNMIITVIFLLQVGFTGDFVPDCPSNCVSASSNFDTAFLFDCTKF